jgi:hypothetical protein
MIVEARLTLWGCYIALASGIYLVNSATDGQWLRTSYLFIMCSATDGAGHRQPFYYYFTTLPVDFLPRTVFSISAAVANIPYRQLSERLPSMFCLVLCVVFVVQRVRY